MQKNQLSGVREMSSKICAFQNHHFVGANERAAKWCLLSQQGETVFPSCGCEIKLAAATEGKILTSTLRLLLQVTAESVIETGFAKQGCTTHPQL